jgi:outer membrane protein
LQEQVAAYKMSFNAAEVRFNAGLGTSVEYLVAKNNLERASINLISSKYDFLLRKQVVDYYAGVR